MKAKTPQWGRKVVLLLGLLGGLWLLGQWVLVPGYLLFTIPVPKTKPRPTSMPSRATLHKLDIYHQVMRSPLLRRLAQTRAAQVLTQHITTSRIERSLRDVLLDQELPQWFAVQRKWDALLLRLEHQFPDFHLEAYRVYLYLQAGQLQWLKVWGDRLLPNVPQQRQSTLMRVWLGHAAFFGGWPKRAQMHYNLALRAYAQHPAWDRRTSRNWKLPAELSTTLYHMGLLSMLQKQPKQALTYFSRMLKRWKSLKHSYESMPLWYLSHLWSAEACFALSDTSGATQHLKQAARFAKDPTLRLLAQSRLTSLQDAAWSTVIASHRTHSLSYADSPWLARMMKSLRLFEQHKTRSAYRLLHQVLQALEHRIWAPTLGMFQRRDTSKIRYLPLAPSIYSALLRYVRQNPTPALQGSSLSSTSTPALQGSSLSPTSTPALQGSARRRVTPTLRAATSPTSKPAWKSHPTNTPHQRVIRDLRMYRVLSQLKLYDWETAISELESIHKHDPTFAPPLLYLGILASHQQRGEQAYRWFSLYHKQQNDKVSLLYLTYSAMSSHPKQARVLLQALKKKKVRVSIVKRLQAILEGKSLSKRTRKAQFWWRVLGAQGILATSDLTLGRQSHFWRVHNIFEQKKEPKQLFRSMHISHQLHRHSLATWLGRYRFLSLFFPKKKKEYLRRLRYIQSFYRRFPHQWYLLDRTMYSNQWGLMALGLF